MSNEQLLILNLAPGATEEQIAIAIGQRAKSLSLPDGATFAEVETRLAEIAANPHLAELAAEFGPLPAGVTVQAVETRRRALIAAGTLPQNAVRDAIAVELHTHQRAAYAG